MQAEAVNRMFIRFMLVLTIGSLAIPVSANVDRRTMLQRQMFQDAEHALKLGRLSQYRQLETKLRDYPLHPYLKYYEIRRRLGSTDYKTIHRFLQEHPGTPLATRLQYSWLKSLARKRQWQTLIDNFYYTTDKGLQCDFARALLFKQEPQRAYSVSEGLWLTGRSLPNRCDYPIEKWHASGGLSQQLVWERIRLSMQARHPRLALYLSKFVDKKDRFWVRVCAKVRRQPEYVVQVHERFAKSDSQQLRWVLAEGIRRMAIRDATAAAELWNNWREEFKFSDIEKDRIERRLALSLAKEDPLTSKQWLEQLALEPNDERVNALYILNALQDQDWEVAMDWIDRLDTDEKHTDRWRYWRGRALEGMGRLEEARAIYLLNADSRSYYGFLSADRAGMSYQFDHRPVSYNKHALSQIQQQPAIARARELYALNRIVDARREWRFALQHLDKSQMLVAAQIAHDWNWHDRAIMTLAQAKYWDDLEKRFPLAHRELVIDNARRQRINPAWAFAIIRQESAFTEDARSHAGAMGLMQLLPRTAKQVARSLQMRFRRNELLVADTNVRLGMHYFKQINDTFKGNNVLATAAYNAGNYRVRTWLPKTGHIPADVWVESVPFNETRDYLKRVLTYTVIYEQRLGQRPVPLLERMLPIPGHVTVISADENKPDEKSGA